RQPAEREATPDINQPVDSKAAMSSGSRMIFRNLRVLPLDPGRILAVVSELTNDRCAVCLPAKRKASSGVGITHGDTRPRIDDPMSVEILKSVNEAAIGDEKTTRRR